jgi:hypothetical protein
MPSPLTTAAVLAGLCGLFVVTTGAFAADPGPQDPVKSCCSGPSPKAVLLTTEGRQPTVPAGLSVAVPTFTRVASTTPFGVTTSQEPVRARVALRGGQQGAGWLNLPEKVSSEDEVEDLRERLEDSLEARLEKLEDLQEQLEDERERLEDLYEELFEDLEEEFEEAKEAIEEEPRDGEGAGGHFPVLARSLTIGNTGQQVLFTSPEDGLRINRVRLLDDCKECGTCDEACCAACEGCGDADCEVELAQPDFVLDEGQNVWIGDAEGRIELGDLGEQIAFEVAEGLNQGLGQNAARWTVATNLGAQGLWVAADGGQVRWIRTDDCKKCEDCSDCREEGRCESCEDCGDEDCDAEEAEEEFAFSNLSFEEPVLLEWSSTPPAKPLPGVTTTVTATEACGPHCELEAEVRAMREDLNALRDLLTPKVN